MPSIILDSDLPADLLTTNRAPDDGELALARTLIRDLESQLFSPTKEMDSPEGAGVITKQSILDTLASLKKVVSPIRRVPADVIQEILLECIDPDPRYFRNDVPCTLSHISSGLRKIALSTSALWAVFHVEINYFYDKSDGDISIRDFDTHKSILRGQKSWLEELIHHRSGNLPLRMSFEDSRAETWGKIFKGGLQECYNDIINLFLSCHSRWGDIHFYTCSTSKSSLHIFSFLKSLTPHDVPQLNEIHFGKPLREFGGMDLFPMAFLASPSLKRIHDITMNHFCEHRAYLPLSTITELNCNGDSGNESLAHFANTLRLCVSLVSLTFSAYTTAGDTNFPEKDIYLPCLQHLSVFGGYSDMWPFTSINAPRLQALELTLYQPIGDWLTEKIVEFFKRSPNIQDLTIICVKQANTMLSILCHCPQLVTLRLPYTFDIYPDWDGVLLRFVHADRAEDILCPKLQYLDINFYDGLIVTDINTLNMLVTRKLEPSPLLAPWKRLKIRFQSFDSQMKEANELLQLADSSRIFLKRVTKVPWYAGDTSASHNILVTI